MSIHKNFIYILLALVTILMLAYANHFDNGFHFDDSHTIVNNASIRSLKNIPSFFSDPSTSSSSIFHRGLRPLTTSSLAIDYWIAGDYNPFMFQLSTFIWHIGLCVMMFYLLKQLLSKIHQHQWVSFVALFGSAFFSIHTAIAETINYIISQNDWTITAKILSTKFIMFCFK